MNETNTFPERWISRVICVAAASILLSEPTQADSPPPPPPLTAEEKVTLSDYVVVGVAKDLYCVKRDPSDPMRIIRIDGAECARDRKVGVVIEVEIVEAICGLSKPSLSKTIRVATPSDFSSPDEKRARYLGKTLLYFLALGKARSGDPGTLDTMTFARGRWTVRPEPIGNRAAFTSYFEQHCRIARSQRGERR